MKVQLVILISFILLSCTPGEITTEATNKDTIAPIIVLNKAVDTAILNSNYKLPFTEVIDNGRCAPVVTTGSVNTTVPGTYFINYDYTDSAGNKSTTATRTVHVVENEARFLTGPYNVACTCTVVTSGIPEPTIVTNNYQATISNYPVNNQFELVQLNTGAQYLIPLATLKGNLIDVAFHRYTNYTATGTLSPSRNSFTIQSKVYEVAPTVSYTCKNVYTKQLVETVLKR